VTGADDLSEMLSHLAGQIRAQGRGSIELRPAARDQQCFASAAATCGLQPGISYCFHRLDLRPQDAEIFGRLHPSHTKRAIRRAEREGLEYETGTSEQMLGAFYQLLRSTRRRHGVPPPPLTWFRNILAFLGDHVAIHLASKNRQPIASLLTLSFKNTMLYKYGCSDAAHHRCGAMPFLFWRLIQDARARGFEELDLGRSDVDQAGLIAFKDHLGAARSRLTYYTYPKSARHFVHNGWMRSLAKQVFARMPDAALDFAGQSIYRHLG
jgi:lipid II:glycine glycyltransferase (peptidoglycan interpeptide bridge formation enzyme)